jgi:DNA-binding transcriptional MerR regulator
MLARVGAVHNSAVAREYRIGELAREAGITVRTLRYYQERKLLPPPRREGRVGWYSEAHLARLRAIGQLLDRGHTLGGTAELLAAWEQGYDLAELLGFERAMTAPWSDAATERLTAAEAAALLGGELTPDLLREAARLGYVEVDDSGTIRVSRRLLDTTAALVHEGIPLPAILAAGRELQSGLDALASLFVELVISHVAGDTDVARLAETITRLRPVARAVIDEEFARAMDRRTRASYAEFMRLLAARAIEPGGRDPGGGDAGG